MAVIGWHAEAPNPLLAAAPADTSRTEYERRQAEQAWRQAEIELEAGRVGAARPWLERAFRFTPSDQNLAFALATARLGDGDFAAALDLLNRIAARHAVREVFVGQAAAALALGRVPDAVGHLAQALAGFTVDPALVSLAERCASITGRPWCGVTGEGRLITGGSADPVVRLDGKRVVLQRDNLRGFRLPPTWRRAAALTADFGGVAALGSPIDLRAIHRVEGVVARGPQGAVGWAWHPGAPETDPVLAVQQDGKRTTIIATDRSVNVSGTAPLTRPRGFQIALAPNERLRVTGSDKRDLLGSPLEPPCPPAPAPLPSRGKAVTVVIPVYRGVQATLDCVRSVIATIGPADRVVVVNDGSPEPALIAALMPLAATGAIRLIASCPDDASRNMGFPAAANAGLCHAGGTDVVLLNSDTVVFPGWLKLLRAAVHSDAGIGTATPFSNDATIFTYPDPSAPSVMPPPREGAEIAALAAAANAGILVETPTGHGFCLYIRAACLHATGLLRQDAFAQGYGEENDFCQRARALGWRHVAVPSVYVAHQGGVSFGAAREHLVHRNALLLDALHPDYHQRVADFITADGLAASRRRLDAARWRAAHAQAAPGLVLITHGGVGGTRRVVGERAQAAHGRGQTPIMVAAEDEFATVDAQDGFPNLRFRLPAELDALIDLVSAARPAAAELHHLLGHDSSVTALLARFGLPYDVWVHDWSWICPRLSLVTPEERFCGEPPVRDCVACAARGEPPVIPLPAAALRARSAALLGGAQRVITASRDGARRITRHFPAIVPAVLPWEPAPKATPGMPLLPGAAMLTIAVVGAIGVEKGYGILLACARDAAARGLKLRFAVIGYTIDDTPLLETGHVSVTGPFETGEAAALIRGSGATLALLPSIWPETWCYALSDIWEGGLNAAVFDIGAPAERVRQAGRGWVLPLGLSPPALNDALLRLQGVAVRSC